MQNKEETTERKHAITGLQMFKAITATIICGIVMLEVCILKYYVIDAIKNPPTMNIWAAMLLLAIAFFVFLGGLLVFLVIARTYIVSNTRYYFAYLSAIAFTFISSLLLGVISPLLVAPGFAAFIIIQLSRKKQDAFIVNFITATMIMFGLLFEYILFGGSAGIFTVIQHNGEYYLWMIITVALLNIGAGAIVPVALRDKTHRLNYALVGAIILVCSIALYMGISAFSQFRMELISYAWLVTIAGVMPILAALLLNPLFESIFNLVTDNRLMELTNSKQPLLRRLATEAPGTYNHSMSVANFAEMCALAIGEDVYLARAAAYYHDVGKLADPSYFTENQAGYNPHDDLLPEVSAEIIRKHTTYGYQLLKEHRLPKEVADIAIEHHGTLPMTVFYERAKKLTDDEVDPAAYSYHGRTPTSKIAGIIMICDSSEAAIRAMDKPDGERVDALLRGIINSRIQQGQFDNCPLSLKDIDTIRSTIINAYGGIFHKRIKYPGGEESER